MALAFFLAKNKKEEDEQKEQKEKAEAVEVMRLDSYLALKKAIDEYSNDLKH